MRSKHRAAIGVMLFWIISLQLLMPYIVVDGKPAAHMEWIPIVTVMIGITCGVVLTSE